MDVADHLRLCEGEEIAVVEQVLGGVLEAVAADVGLGHAVSANGGAHCTVDDGDSTFQNFLKRVLVGCRHFPLISFHARCGLALMARASRNRLAPDGAA